jgi:S1-C subfamily serine protease
LDLGENMLIVRQDPQSFEEIVTYVLPSVVAIAVGADNERRPIIEGTGFAIEHTGIFATCKHVASKYRQLSRLEESEVIAQGMSDKALRLAVRMPDGSYTWRTVNEGTFMCCESEELDICIFRLIDVAIPPLALHSNDVWDLGAEVGVIGFPMGNRLQGNTIRPYTLKTIVSGALEYAVGDDIRVPQVVLGTSTANGFSGGPVFSSKDGSVVGMVRSHLLEEGDPRSIVRMPTGLSLAISPNSIRRGMHDLFSISTGEIQQALWPDTYANQPE